MTRDVRITAVEVLTVCVPLMGRIRHSDGTDLPHQTKHLIKVHTDVGVVGLGEVGPRVGAEALKVAGKQIVGESAFNLERLRVVLQSEKFYRMESAMVRAAFQMAVLDIQGKVLGLAVSQLLGGTLRDTVDLICDLYRIAPSKGQRSVETTDEIVEHARELVDHYGFRTIKFKAGVVSPKEDIEVMNALRAEFPTSSLRIDPNGSWSVETAINVGRQLQCVNLEWIEDPTLGIPGMAEFNRRVAIPTATNMFCIQPREVPLAVSAHAVNIILLDLWYLGGPWSAKQMAAMCVPFGLGVGVHSGGGSCELGVGLSAQLHLAASLPGLVHAVDGQYHHLLDDVIVGGPLRYVNGAIEVPKGPGLGVELDEAKCEQYQNLYAEIHEEPHNRGYFYPKW